MGVHLIRRGAVNGPKWSWGLTGAENRLRVKLESAAGCAVSRCGAHVAMSGRGVRAGGQESGAELEGAASFEGGVPITKAAPPLRRRFLIRARRRFPLTTHHLSTTLPTRQLAWLTEVRPSWYSERTGPLLTRHCG